MSPKIKVVVFDFDGVILESADVKTGAFCELYAEYGPDIVAAVRDHHVENMGISRFKKFAWIAENLLGRTITDAESQALGEQFSKLALERVIAAPFVSGVYDALILLAPLYPLFVASGTPQQELDLIISRRELGHLFREVHGTPREKPFIIGDIVKRYRLSADEVLFIGDGVSDYQAASMTGTAFLARDTPLLHDQWTALGVAVCPDLSDLPRWVDRWR